MFPLTETLCTKRSRLACRQTARVMSRSAGRPRGSNLTSPLGSRRVPWSASAEEAYADNTAPAPSTIANIRLILPPIEVLHASRGLYNRHSGAAGLAAEERAQQAARRGALLEVALVVVLGHPERRGGLDLGHDRIAKALLRPLDHAPSRLGLLVGLGEDHRAVLPADVRALPVQLRGVVELEVLGDKILVADLRGVERDLADLDVSGRAGADLLVSGIVDVAALIAHCRIDHAVELAERCLHLPEAARSKGRLLGGARGAVLARHLVPSDRLGLNDRICPLVARAATTLRRRRSLKAAAATSTAS